MSSLCDLILLAQRWYGITHAPYSAAGPMLPESALSIHRGGIYIMILPNANINAVQAIGMEFPVSIKALTRVICVENFFRVVQGASGASGCYNSGSDEAVHAVNHRQQKTVARACGVEITRPRSIESRLTTLSELPTEQFPRDTPPEISPND